MWIFTNAGLKMLSQLSGEAHIERQRFESADREQMLLAVRSMTGEEAHELVAIRLNDEHYRQGAEYNRLLTGSRCSRLEWRTADLKKVLTDPAGASQQASPRRHDSNQFKDTYARTPKRNSILTLDDTSRRLL